MAYISKGLTLKFQSVNTAGTAIDTYFANLGTEVFPNLQEIGEISMSGAGGSYDQIEITTLADAKHVYTDGLIADADSGSNEITFKFLYEPVLFKALKDAMALESSNTSGEHNKWIIEIPEGGTFTITGDIANLKMDSVSTNSALTFVLAVAVREITIV